LRKRIKRREAQYDVEKNISIPDKRQLKENSNSLIFSIKACKIKEIPKEETNKEGEETARLKNNPLKMFVEYFLNLIKRKRDIQSQL